VTLAACRTGQQSHLPGEEPTGLVRGLLEMGARTVIASHWAVCDRSASLWMRTFYDHYLAGQPLQAAFDAAVTAVKRIYPSAYNWAAFSIFGAG
jgi:CHAT domain-containing protein